MSNIYMLEARPEDITRQYHHRKAEYIERIKNLVDHVEIDYPDGGAYTGQIINNLKEGQGIFCYPSGDVYFGGWKNNQRNCNFGVEYK